jgi:antitoxin VapB
MKTAKVFKNGRSQAIRLPKEYQVEGKDVYIKKFEDIILLIPKKNPWNSFVNSLELFSDDFLKERKDLKIQNRKKVR